MPSSKDERVTGSDLHDLLVQLDGLKQSIEEIEKALWSHKLAIDSLMNAGDSLSTRLLEQEGEMRHRIREMQRRITVMERSRK